MPNRIAKFWDGIDRLYKRIALLAIIVSVGIPAFIEGYNIYQHLIKIEHYVALYSDYVKFDDKREEIIIAAVVSEMETRVVKGRVELHVSNTGDLWYIAEETFKTLDGEETRRSILYSAYINNKDNRPVYYDRHGKHHLCKPPPKENSL